MLSGASRYWAREIDRAVRERDCRGLVHAIRHQKDIYIGSMILVIRTVADIDCESSVQPVRDLFTHPDDLIRQAVIEALAKLDPESPETAALVRAGLEDPARRVRISSLCTLRVRGEEDVLLLRRGLSDSDGWTRLHAAESLARANDGASADQVEKLARAESRLGGRRRRFLAAAQQLRQTNT